VSLNHPFRKQPPELVQILQPSIFNDKFLQHLHLVFLPANFRDLNLLENLLLLLLLWRPVLQILVVVPQSQLRQRLILTLLTPHTSENKVIQTPVFTTAGANSSDLEEKKTVSVKQCVRSEKIIFGSDFDGNSGSGSGSYVTGISGSNTGSRTIFFTKLKEKCC